MRLLRFNLHANNFGDNCLRRYDEATGLEMLTLFDLAGGRCQVMQNAPLHRHACEGRHLINLIRLANYWGDTCLRRYAETRLFECLCYYNAHCRLVRRGCFSMCFLYIMRLNFFRYGNAVLYFDNSMVMEKYRP